MASRSALATLLFSFVATIGVALAAGMTARADDAEPTADEMPAPAPKRAGSGAGAPRLRSPRFPLEPGRREAEPARPETYVEAPTTPPVSAADAAVIPRRDKAGWGTTLQLTWFDPSQVSHHSFTSPSGTGHAVRGDFASPLSLQGVLRLRPPGIPLSLELRGSGISGNGLVSGDFTGLHYSATDLRGTAGLLIHPLRRQSSSDLRIGADAGAYYTNYLTLTPALNGIDVDARTVFVVVPRIAYEFAPSENWAFEIGASKAFPLRVTGAGDVSSTDFARLEAEIQARRYVSEGNAFGLGMQYARQTATWQQTAPFALNDAQEFTELRVALFWRHDF